MLNFLAFKTLDMTRFFGVGCAKC